MVAEPKAKDTEDAPPDAFELTLSQAGIGWVLWEPDSGHIACNHIAASLMGLSNATALHLSAWLSAIADADRPRLEDALLGYDGQEARTVEVEYRLPHPHQRPQHVQARGWVGRDGHHGTLRGSALLLDVTDAREQERLLRVSEARFREAFSKAPVAMALTSRNDVLVDVNHAFTALTGHDRDAIIGRPAKELGFWSSAEDQEKLDTFLNGAEGSATLELHLRTRTGRVRQVLISITRIPDGDDAGFVKVLLDITERRGLERKLVKALRTALRDTDWLAQRLLNELATLEGDPVERPLITDLTRRERQVLELLARGLSNESAATELGITPSTVRNYVSTIYSKLALNTRAEAIVWAREHGLGGE